MIKTLQDAICQQLRQALPGVQVAFYPRLEEDIPHLPLLALEIAEFEPGDDAGTHQLALCPVLQARLVLDPTQPDAEADMPHMAARVALEIHRATNFGLPVSPARIRQIGPDDFKPQLDGYLVWLIEWVHQLDAGVEADLTLSQAEQDWMFSPQGTGDAL